MNPPHLESERLIIQPLRNTDAGSLFAIRSQPDVVRFQSVMFENELEAQRFIQNHEGFDFGIPNTWFQLGIYLKQNEELIGDIGVHFLDKNIQTVEIGYTIAPEHQRKGYAFETVSRMLAFFFTVPHTNMVIAVTEPQNHPSMQLLNKLGFAKSALESLPCPIEILPGDVIFTLSRPELETG